MAEILNCEITGDETEEERRAKIDAVFNDPDLRRAIEGSFRFSERLAKKRAGEGKLGGLFGGTLEEDEAARLRHERSLRAFEAFERAFLKQAGETAEAGALQERGGETAETGVQA